MDKLKGLVFLSLVVFLLSLTCLVGVTTYQALFLPERIAQYADARVKTLEGEVHALRSDLQKTSATVRRTLDTVPKTVDRRLASVQDDLNTQVSDAIARADYQLTSFNTSVDSLVSGAKPILENTASLTEQVDNVARDNLTCKGNGNCWPAGVTAALGGLKVTLGESALTMRKFRKTEDDFLEIGKSIAANVDKTTSNVERITRPTKWYWKFGAIAAGGAWGVVK